MVVGLNFAVDGVGDNLFQLRVTGALDGVGARFGVQGESFCGDVGNV